MCLHVRMHVYMAGQLTVVTEDNGGFTLAGVCKTTSVEGGGCADSHAGSSDSHLQLPQLKTCDVTLVCISFARTRLQHDYP